MATTQITVSAFQTLCAECADAINSGDWATATKKYAMAEAINVGLDVEITDAGAAGATVRRRESLAGLKTAIETAQKIVNQTSGQGGFINTRTRHN